MSWTASWRASLRLGLGKHGYSPGRRTSGRRTPRHRSPRAAEYRRERGLGISCRRRRGARGLGQRTARPEPARVLWRAGLLTIVTVGRGRRARQKTAWSEDPDL